MKQIKRKKSKFGFGVNFVNLIKTFLHGIYKAQVIWLYYFLPDAKFLERIYISFGKKLTPTEVYIGIIVSINIWI